jgi:hypothetical protein
MEIRKVELIVEGLSRKKISDKQIKMVLGVKLTFGDPKNGGHVHYNQSEKVETFINKEDTVKFPPGRVIEFQGPVTKKKDVSSDS